MAIPSPPKEDHPSLEMTMQESILHQAQAAAAAQTHTTRSKRHKASQEADLITLDEDDPDMPLPPYEEYGEMADEKEDMDTSVSVSDDGRVTIRINYINRRISRIFAPAIWDQIQSAQDVQESRPSTPPASPGDEEASPPPPPLNIVMHVVGSRGDVQPFIALGKVLKEVHGHRVRLATHPSFRSFVLENGLEFFSIGGDPSRLMAFMVKNPSLLPGFRSIMSGDVGQQRKLVSEYIQGCWRSCFQDGDGMDLEDGLSSSRPFVADCIIANPPSFAHIHCAEKLGIPLHILFTMPYSPTQSFPHPLANIQSSNTDPQLTNYISYAMIEVLSWQGLGDIINRFRAKCLGLDPISLTWAPGMFQRLQIPHTYCWSQALIPKPKDWGPHISISGFSFLNLASRYSPAPDLQAFLDAGPPPVYIGFGSIVLNDPDAMTELVFETAKKIGQRVLLSKGWGGVGANRLHIPDNVFMLGNVPHDWLFQHVSCVVHHGGAGTTAAGIAAGRPTVVVPFFGDQHFWGAMIARAGAGPDPIPHTQLSADKLVHAIRFCLRPESLERAKELAGKIAAEPPGREMGARLFHQHLDPDRLRCTLAPSRAAAWRIKRTQIRLSPFAACTLANAGLLDFKDLKLFRAQEYETDKGPWDPISGGFVAVCGALSGMTMGLADVPSETIKALQLPFRSSGRQPSLESQTARSGEPSHTTSTRERSASLQSPEARRMSMALRDPPSLASSLSSSTMSGPGKGHHDMLRPTGVHMSRGIGRFTKALVQSPMDLSMSFAKGFHNLPRMWGDDTVRPQEKVSDFVTGAKAAGKEFGLGWYDGVTGLVTQPWKGAQKEGASGFFKGIGKGMGGFVAKPGAALFGIPGYVMKGVHKEVQKLFGSNVQNYIVASRVAQGYEEWLQSSDAEKEDVILRWKLVQKYLKKKEVTDPGEMVSDVLETQRRMAGNTENGHVPRPSNSFP